MFKEAEEFAPPQLVDHAKLRFSGQVKAGPKSHRTAKAIHLTMCQFPRALILTLVLFLATAGCNRRAVSPPAPVSLGAAEQLAIHNRVVGLMGRFDYSNAVKELEKLTATDPGNLEYQVDLAIALLNRREERDLERSLELLDKVLRQDPNNVRAIYCRGLLSFHNGELSAAADLFERVLEADPQDAYAVYYIGQCRLADGDAAAALKRFQSAAEIDPYLRSAFYGAFQAAQRVEDADLSKQMFEEFQKLEKNPRARLAELKYTRMGPKSEVSALDQPPLSKHSPPTGPVFDEMSDVYLSNAGEIAWRTWTSSDAPPDLTIADMNGDGRSDLFLAAAVQSSDGQSVSTVLIADESGYQCVSDHPLSGIKQVNTALWGDFDNDGLVDVYLCREGDNQLWQQRPGGTWTDVTDSTATGGGSWNTVDGACYDIDHDGDLDYLLINADGPRQALSNNRDGTFRENAEELGIAGNNSGSQRIVIGDFDTDDDADLLIINNDLPHDVYINERLWRYRQAQGFDELKQSELRSAIAMDADVDGQVEIYTNGARGIQRWTRGESNAWQANDVAPLAEVDFAIVDCDGDSLLDLVSFQQQDWNWRPLSHIDPTASFKADADLSSVILVGPRGPTVVACRSGKPPTMWEAGPGRDPFVLLQFNGKHDKGAEMRSNASGIGVQGSARIADRWATIPASRSISSPGQSLQPWAIGLGGAAKIDFIRLLWPDSVSQTEIDLDAGKLHDITETQRQAGSCPLVFVWDGEGFDFVADALGAGGIGFNLGRGDYYPSRPVENLLLPAGLPVPKDGRQLVKLGEPMEEICYFDSVELTYYDLPPGWQMTLDERFGGLGPSPTGDPIFFRRRLVPVKAKNHQGEDVTSTILQVDAQAAPIGRSDQRFTGVGNPHSLELEFDGPIDEMANPVLVFNGWVEYAYSQTAFAAWQAGVEYIEPSIEARDAEGAWHMVAERFGYPAGTSRELAFPLQPELLPPGTSALRIATNMQVYWDRITLVDAEPCPEAARMKLPLVMASVRDVGFSTRKMGPQRNSRYDYNQRPPFGDTRHPAGFYTAFGDALPLVAETDDALAIIGPGEELHLEYAAAENPVPTAWRRQYVLEMAGWCKDADLFTKDAGTVTPLPNRGDNSGNNDSSRREKLHRKYNTRYRSGW